MNAKEVSRARTPEEVRAEIVRRPEGVVVPVREQAPVRMRGEVGETGCRRLAPAHRALLGARVADRDDLLEPAHTDAFGHHSRGEAVLEIGVLYRQQGAGVAGRDDSGGHSPLHGRRELQQPDRVADLGAGATDS